MKIIFNQKQEYQDADLIQGIKEGDDKALVAFYKMYFPRIKQYVLKNNGTVNDAEDLFQEATMVLYKKIQMPSFELTSSLYTYLYAVGKRQWLNKLKKQSRDRFELPENDLLESKDIQIIDESEQHTLYRAKFLELGENCQKIMNLFFQKVKMEDIAAKMNISKAYAKKRKFQCKEKLISLIKKDIRYSELMNP